MSNSSSTPNIPKYKDFEDIIEEEQLALLMAMRYHLLIMIKKLTGLPVTVEDLVLSMHMRLRSKINEELESD